MERKVNVSWYSLLENSSEHLVSFDEFVRGRDQVFWSEHFQDYWIVVGLRPSLYWEMKNCRSCGQGRRVWLLLFMRRVLIVPPSRYCDHNIALLFKSAIASPWSLLFRLIEDFKFPFSFFPHGGQANVSLQFCLQSSEIVYHEAILLKHLHLEGRWRKLSWVAEEWRRS